MTKKFEERSMEEHLKSFYEALDRVGERLDRSSAEADKRKAELDAERKKQKAYYDAEFKRRDEEAAKRKKEFDEEIRKLNESMGHYTNNIGYIAEEYFFNSFKAGKTNFFGENFDEINKNVKGIKKDFEDEYDILLRNGKSVIIVEVKNKANVNDIPKIQRKTETFRINFPEYKKHKVYLGFASMGFYTEVEQECQKNGIAIIKQVGETLVIFDENLKVY